MAILLTHGHFDHAGAAASLAEKYGLLVYAHEKEAETLADSRINLSGPMAGGAVTYHADIFLKDEQEIDLAGFHIRVLFTPGHTPGGVVTIFRERTLSFPGILFFAVPSDARIFRAEVARLLVESVRNKLMTLPENTIVYPGHDVETSIEQERMYNPFL